MRTVEQQKEICRQINASLQSHYIAGTLEDAHEDRCRLDAALGLLEQMMLDEAAVQFTLFRKELNQ